MNYIYDLQITKGEFKAAFMNAETSKYIELSTKSPGHYKEFMDIVTGKNVLICYKQWNYNNIILALIIENKDYIGSNEELAGFARMAKDRIDNNYDEVKDRTYTKSFYSIDLSIQQRGAIDLEIVKNNLKLEPVNNPLMYNIKAIFYIYERFSLDLYNRGTIRHKLKLLNFKLIGKDDYVFFNDIANYLYRKSINDFEVKLTPNLGETININHPDYLGSGNAIYTDKDISSKSYIKWMKYNDYQVSLEGVRYRIDQDYNVSSGINNNIISCNDNEFIMKIDLRSVYAQTCKSYLPAMLMDGLKPLNKDLNTEESNKAFFNIYKSLIDQNSFTYLPGVYFNTGINSIAIILSLLDKLKNHSDILYSDKYEVILKTSEEDYEVIMNIIKQSNVCLNNFPVYEKLVIRDYNDYLLIDKCGSCHGKGFFDKNILKNNKPVIVYDSIVNYFRTEESIVDYINRNNKVLDYTYCNTDPKKTTAPLGRYFSSYSINSKCYGSRESKVGYEVLDEYDRSKEYAINKSHYIKMAMELLNSIETTQTTLF